MSVLGRLQTSSQIKQLNEQELKELTQDVRDKIIKTVSDNGGHLSSNLGIAELTVALYKTFDFPKDKIIFDVGHQCYAHKILSDRNEKFATIRLDGGISGFPDIKESEYDSFGAGHAGTSISAGIGLCTARDFKGEKENVIVVVGDASLSNGLNLEAITSSIEKPKNLIVILNDNGMSISKNRNGLYQLLSKGSIKHSYVKSKNIIKRIFKDSFITRFFVKVKNLIKRLVKGNNYFEQFGFKYVGVVDGNDIHELTKILSRVKVFANNKAVLLHINTKKGKGYKEAEDRADVFHGVGKQLRCSNGKFGKALADKLNSVIEKDKNIVCITAGMKSGTGLDLVEKEHKGNFFDVGIAEEYAVTFSAGLAVGGLKPVVAIYSTFLQRAYDQILHDVCIQNLPVVFCLDRAGFVGEDGKTHQGLYDLSFLSELPNMTILAPNNACELNDCVDYALSLKSPVAIRYPKDYFDDTNTSPISEKPWLNMTNQENYEVCVLAVGPKMKSLALQYAEKTKRNVEVISVRVVKPLDKKFLDNLDRKCVVVTLEENSKIGGFGSAVATYLSERNIKTIVMGAKDCFTANGSVDNQLKWNGLTLEDIDKLVEESI